MLKWIPRHAVPAFIAMTVIDLLVVAVFVILITEYEPGIRLIEATGGFVGAHYRELAIGLGWVVTVYFYDRHTNRLQREHDELQEEVDALKKKLQRRAEVADRSEGTASTPA